MHDDEHKQDDADFEIVTADLSEADARLQAADVEPRQDINSARRSAMGEGHGGMNVALNYSGPDGVMIDISQIGWVGTGAKKAHKNGHHENGESE